MKSLAEDWLKEAKDDLTFAETYLPDPLSSVKVLGYSRQSMEKSFRAVAESRNIEIPFDYNLIQLGKLAKHYAPELDIEIAGALDENEPIEAAKIVSYAKQILDICARNCHNVDLNDDSIWDYHTLLYF